VVSRFKEQEAQVERLREQLQLFQRISRLMVKELSLQETLQAINRMLVEYMRCDSCLIYLIDDDKLVLCSANNPAPDTLGKVRLSMSEGLTGWVARERRLLAISQEAYKDPRFRSFAELPEDEFEAFLSTPIIARNRVVGVINIQHRRAHTFSGDEMEMLTTVGEQIGSLLILARMDPQAVNKASHVNLVFANSL
jgi:signal transduction protein with GAF and PtsI domain